MAIVACFGGGVEGGGGFDCDCDGDCDCVCFCTVDGDDSFVGIEGVAVEAVFVVMGLSVVVVLF